MQPSTTVPCGKTIFYRWSEKYGSSQVRFFALLELNNVPPLCAGPSILLSFSLATYSQAQDLTLSYGRPASGPPQVLMV